MNITEYVRDYGHLTFDENPFNEADALIMAQMAYLNWEIVAPRLTSQSKWPTIIKNVSDGINVELNAGEFDSKRSEKLFLLMKASKRFSRMKVRFVSKIDSLDNTLQFFGVTLTLPNGTHVVSFRGTDLTINGWKEDAMLAFADEIPSQGEAVKYVDTVMSMLKGPFIIVGHSKGGNLSYFAAMKMKTTHRRRLINAYSFDGPGFFSEKIYDTKQYAVAKKKLIKFIPFDSVVGIMLNHEHNAEIIDSMNVAVFQHDPFSWKITEQFKFVRRDKRQITSKLNERALVHFLEDMSLEERKETADAIFELMGKPDQSLIDLTKNIPKTVKHFNTTLKSFPKEKRKHLIYLVFKFFASYRKAARYFLFQEKR